MADASENAPAADAITAQGQVGSEPTGRAPRGRSAASFRPADPGARSAAASAALARLNPSPNSESGPGAGGNAPPPAPALLRDPADAAADVGTLVELAALGVGVVRWRRGGPPPNPGAGEFWAAGAVDVLGEFAPGMPRLVNSVALRIAGKVGRMALTFARGAVDRALQAERLAATATKGTA